MADFVRHRAERIRHALESSVGGQASLAVGSSTPPFPSKR